MPPERIIQVLQPWLAWAHEHQRPPLAASGGADWNTWLILGGRGAGKTRAGAEWVRGVALGVPGFSEHAAGAHRAGRRDRARRARSDDRGRLRHPGGACAARAAGMAARRGGGSNGRTARSRKLSPPRTPRACAARNSPPPGADEIAKWRHADATFDMLQFGLRLGERPRLVVTTTPRPIALLKRLIADPATALTHASTRENAYHLSPAFIDTVFARYGGTRLGRQELDGELIEDRPDALWSRALIERCRVARGAGAHAHRGRGRSAGVEPRKGPTPAAWSPPACAEDGIVYVLADDSAGGLRRPAGRPRRSRSGVASRPTRWSPK